MLQPIAYLLPGNNIKVKAVDLTVKRIASYRLDRKSQDIVLTLVTVFSSYVHRSTILPATEVNDN